jgi:hypothetical protein
MCQLAASGGTLYGSVIEQNPHGALALRRRLAWAVRPDIPVGVGEVVAGDA